jgi:hypothetical protein
MSDEEVSVPVKGKDILNIEMVNIPAHALGRFQMRTGMELVEAASQVRERLGASTLIERHRKVKLNKKKGICSYYFQDASDEDLVFVVSKNPHRDCYTLTTVLHPLRNQTQQDSPQTSS